MKIKNENHFKSNLTANFLKYFHILFENSDDSKASRNGESAFTNHIKKLYAGRAFTYFDIGANVGEYSDLLLNNHKFSSLSAHLFEPQKRCVEHLHKKFNGNSVVTINSFGLSDQDSTSNLYTDTDSSPLGSLYKRDLSAQNKNMDIVESIDLKRADTYIQSNHTEKINFIKLDVEGHELSVFKGFGEYLDPNKIDFIQFEYGGANLDSFTTLREIHHVLSEKGFVLCKLMRTSLEIRPYHPRLENFRYQNWVAVSPRLL